MNGAYYIFGRRYSILSFELQDLHQKTENHTWLPKVQLPIDVTVWSVIFLTSAFGLRNSPSWLPHVLLSASIALIAFILIIMLDGMRRIWNLGVSSKSAFPNQRMFYLLCGTYFAYFVGEVTFQSFQLALHIMDGDLLGPETLADLILARYWVYVSGMIS